MILIGYSGHALVAAGILELMGKPATAYCDIAPKTDNPLQLTYLGSENHFPVQNQIEDGIFFISIGDNALRRKIAMQFEDIGKYPLTIIHPSAILDKSAYISERGAMIAAGVKVNGRANIGQGAILNTGCIVEHECKIGSFAHIGPGAILCGNVSVGENTFIGAGAVIRQGITLGKNAIVGAGAVVLNDISDCECVVGNPARHLKNLD